MPQTTVSAINRWQVSSTTYTQHTLIIIFWNRGTTSFSWVFTLMLLFLIPLIYSTTRWCFECQGNGRGGAKFSVLVINCSGTKSFYPKPSKIIATTIMMLVLCQYAAAIHRIHILREKNYFVKNNTRTVFV